MTSIIPSYCQIPENEHSMSIVRVRLNITKGVTNFYPILSMTTTTSGLISVCVTLHLRFYMLNSSTFHLVLPRFSLDKEK
jgi:hypothetical protein